ncbi:MAG: hypothetical protein NUV74_19260 [Candidatus Brocadiaceae bacterium]|nr:hypothetical protein [Candidatus Brocadiaceae bacterium]
MKGKGIILVPFIVLFLSLFLSQNLPAEVNRVMHDTVCSKIHDNRALQGDPQSAIQNLSPTSSGDPKFEKAEVVRRTKRLQMPFIANEGQTDEKVAFYANTFGGTVFVTKDGDIVYSLPMAAHASPLVHDEINKDKTGYTGLTGFLGKEGQCIVHRALCTMYPYCAWNFPVYYSETNSPLCNTETNSPVCHSERSEESHLNNSLPEPVGWVEQAGETQQAPRVETQCLASLMRSPNGISPLKRGTHPLIPSREGNGVCNTIPTTLQQPSPSVRNLLAQR